MDTHIHIWWKNYSKRWKYVDQIFTSYAIEKIMMIMMSIFH